MQDRTTELLQKAEHMEKLAAHAADEATRNMYAGMALQWRELADQLRRANEGGGEEHRS